MNLLDDIANLEIFELVLLGEECGYTADNRDDLETLQGIFMDVVDKSDIKYGNVYEVFFALKDTIAEKWLKTIGVFSCSDSLT